LARSETHCQGNLKKSFDAALAGFLNAHRSRSAAAVHCAGLSPAFD
jgi:hypothetical protein